MDVDKIEIVKAQFQPFLRQGEAYVRHVEDFVRQIPPTQIYIAVGVVLFTTILLVLTTGIIIGAFKGLTTETRLVRRASVRALGVIIALQTVDLIASAQWRNPSLWKQAFYSSQASPLYFVRVFKHTISNTIVLTGLSGGGKTVLFYQLRDGSSHQGTVTSMEPNEGLFVLNSETSKKGKIKAVHLVDVPGHSRLRPKLDEYLPRAAGVVFVVDAVEFLPNCRAASEYLYDILTKASVVKRKIPLLILCNKVDKVTAHTKEFIKKQLEKEIDKLRTSRKAVSDADISNEFTLGVPGEAFSFSQCINKVAVAEASGLTGEILPLEQFIRERVKP